MCYVKSMIIGFTIDGSGGKRAIGRYGRDDPARVVVGSVLRGGGNEGAVNAGGRSPAVENR